MVMSTSKQPVSRTYKPRGTGVLVCNNMTAMVDGWSRDRMGRWAEMRFKGSQGKCFRCIMAYQVSSGKNKGKNTASNQQQATLIKETVVGQTLERIEPRKAFIRDLQAHVEAAQATGDAIILCGDFNELMSEERSRIANLAEACGLVDLFSVRLGTNRAPATCRRGSKRINFALLLLTLMMAVQSAGYNPFRYRINSNH